MASANEPLSGPPRIERPPEAASFSIEKLIGWGREGRLRIPHFQRRFKWKNEDRIALFDSIERGYPIGTLLLWKRTDNPDGGFLEGVHPEKPPSDAYWLVDGQQRIMTLWDALARPPMANDPCLSFDFETSEFRFLPSGATGNSRLPVYVLLDATELSEWLVEHKWPSDRMRRAFELGKRIRQCTVPAYIVDAGDERVVRHIFDRTNSTGKALTRDEVFDAFAGTSLGKGARKGIDRVNDRLTSLGFGEVQRSTILNALEAILEFRIGKMELQDVTPDQSEDGLDKTAMALAQVIEFFRSAHIPHVTLVPYELLFVVLARFFHVFPKPAHRSRVLLRRWLWRAALRQQLTGASGSLQEHVDDITHNEHESVQRILARTGAGEPMASIDLRRRLSVGSALGRLTACALIGLRPRDLLTGELLHPDEIFLQGIEKAVRKIVGASGNDQSDHLERTIANRLVHAPVPGVGAARLIVGSNDQAALFSHAIDHVALDALRQGDYQAFLERRILRLEEWVAQFTTQHAEWGADDSPPIDSLRYNA